MPNRAVSALCLTTWETVYIKDDIDKTSYSIGVVFYEDRAPTAKDIDASRRRLCMLVVVHQKKKKKS